MPNAADIDHLDYANALSGQNVRLPLSDEYRKRLLKHCAEPFRRNKLWEHFICPHLLLEELDQHIPVHEGAMNNFSDQRSCLASELVESGETVQECLSLFSNLLRRPAYGPGYPRRDCRWHRDWEKPSDRAVIGPFWVFTYEWDSDDPRALQKQFDWIWEKDPDGLTAMERLDAHLRTQFKDYRGYTAVWSGGKSVHIHLVFDPRHMCRGTIADLAKIAGKSPEAKIRDHWQGDIRQDVIWEYYRIKWWELHDLFEPVAGITVQFDTNSQTLFQKRRLPWGARIAERDDPLGFQEGDQIPQAVLGERLGRTSPRSANGYFLTAENANQLPSKVPARSGGGYAIELEADEILVAIRSYLKKHWGCEYPKPAKISDDGGRLYLFFFNHPSDHRPASYVREDHSRIVYLGKNAPTDKGAVSALPGGIRLIDLLRILVEEDETRGKVIEDKNLCPRRPITQRPAFKMFARNAEDRSLSGIRSGMAAGARYLSEESPRSMIVSIEGAGKSTSLIRQALEFHLEDLIENYFGGKSFVRPGNGFHIVACRTYDQVEEQFQRYCDWCKQEGTPINAVTIKSFEQHCKEYSEACANKQDRPISWNESLDKGYNSRVEAIYHEQPKIYAEITKRKNADWRLPNTSTGKPRKGLCSRLNTLVFTTQKLAQEFNEPSLSKAWLHPDFDPKMTPEQWLPLALEFKAYRIIHDEISMDDLLHIATEEEFELASKFRELVEKCANEGWSEVSMSNRWHYFKTRASVEQKEFGFDNILSVIDAGFQPEHLIVVDFEKLPFGRDNHDEGLYKGKSGAGIYVKEKSWWFDTRARISVTTTESLVAEIAGRLFDADGCKAFRVERWDGEQFFYKDEIELIPDNRACKAHIQDLVDDVLTDPNDPTEVVITDMAKGGDVYSHHKARGRNDLDGKNISTVLTFIGGEEYAKLNAIAQKYDIANLIELFYRDRLNQAAGRNRGLRSLSPEPLKHKLRVSPTLIKVLGSHVFFGKGRYPAYLNAA